MAASERTSSVLDFNRLLQQSRQLNAEISGSRNIPMLYRGLEQIEAATNRLAARVGILSNELR